MRVLAVVSKPARIKMIALPMMMMRSMILIMMKMKMIAREACSSHHEIVVWISDSVFVKVNKNENKY